MTFLQLLQTEPRGFEVRNLGNYRSPMSLGLGQVAEFRVDRGEIVPRTIARQAAVYAAQTPSRFEPEQVFERSCGGGQIPRIA